MRGMWYRDLRDDRGMTLVEILVAVVILFVILTGVLGLVGTTTSMSVQAKHQNVVTNVTSAYVEWLHSLPFEEVDLVGEGDGILDPTDPRHVFSVEEFDVSITPEVTPGDNDFLKNVRVSVMATRADGLVHQLSTTVVIRDRDQHMTQAARTPETDPTVEFTSLTPPADTVVWGSQWEGGSLTLQVRAKASEGRTVDRVIMVSGGYVLHDSALNVAEWYEIGEAEWENTPAFVWDSAHEIQEEDGTSRIAFPDGWHTVSVLAYDNYGGEAMATRRFYVNNSAPEEPGPPTVPANPSPPDPLISWEEPSSGPVYAYEFELRRQGVTDTGIQSPFDDENPWSELLEQDGPENTYALTSVPFSRYMARVFAKSPRYDMGYTSYRSDWVEGEVFMTRPLLGGEYVVQKTSTGPPSGRGWRVTANLSVTPPTFPTSTVTTYAFYEVVDGIIQEPPLQSGSSNEFTHVVEVSGNPSSGNFPETYYVVIVTYTPSGFDGGDVQTVSSNTVVTAYKNNPGTYTFTEGTW